MQIFNYDRQGVFTHSSTARESPKEPGKYLIPASATANPPPVTEPNDVAVYDEITQVWHIKRSLLGKTIWETATRRPKECDQHLLSDSLYTDKEPLPGSVWDAEKQDWVITDESYSTQYAEQKQLLVLMMRQFRNTLRDGGLEVDPGIIINTNATGRTALKEILTYLETAHTPVVDFQTLTGWINLGPVKAREYDQKIAQFVQDCFTACRLHEESINDPSMDTIEQVLAYDYSGGWPANRLS